jgi:hypothetical protein
MKNCFLILLLLTAAGLAGCSTHYSVTLRNGSTVTALTKPRLDPSGTRYLFKDAAGQPVEVSRMAVREIAPESMRSPGAAGFQPNSSK